MTKEEVLEAVKGMSVLELADLVKLLEEEFGVSAAAADGNGGWTGSRSCRGGARR